MTTTTPRSKLLVIVHPGSACGSADFNLGRASGHAIRQCMVAEIEAWCGDMCVIDGRLSSELAKRQYFALGSAIRRALSRNRAAGFMTGRRFGCDSMMGDGNQIAAARRLIRDRKLRPGAVGIVLSGAWFNPSDRDGCVNDVRRVFVRAGFEVRISEGAARMVEEPDSFPEAPPAPDVAPAPEATGITRPLL
jgi:hypothetical protein